MKSTIIICFFLTMNYFSTAQNEKQCMKTIRGNLKETNLSRYKDKITIAGDTIVFTNGVLIVNNTKPELLSIFSQGIISPQTFGITTIADTISISDVEMSSHFRQSKNKKVYSFLLYRKMILNPSMFLFELTTPRKINSTTDFIKKAELKAFGFCSILL